MIVKMMATGGGGGQSSCVHQHKQGLEGVLSARTSTHSCAHRARAWSRVRLHALRREVSLPFSCNRSTPTQEHTVNCWPPLMPSDTVAGTRESHMPTVTKARTLRSTHEH